MVRALLMSTALASLGSAGAAYGQTAETTTADAAPAGQVGEVVVTARRRAEDLQSVPVSVTAMSGATVDQLNIRNFQDLRGTVPNLEVLPLATGGANLTIRGIGQGSSQVNVDAKTGFYMDEVYIARQEGNQLYFYDVDNVQVLKGPQGTLFGKNTTAGAFLVTSARPTADGSSYIRLRAGSLNRIDTEGGINIPINDQLMTRFSFRTQSVDGYVKHLLDDIKGNNINDQSARFQVRWQPTEKFTADLLGEFNKSETNGQDSVMIGCRNNAAYVRNYNATHSVPLCSAYPLLDQSNGPITYGGATLNIPTSAAVTDLYRGADATSNNISALRQGGAGHRGAFNDTEVKTVNMRLNYDLTDQIALKSITGMRRSTSQFYNPTLNAPNDIYAEYDTTATTQFTQEFNLNGRAFENKLNYVLGAFYYSQKTHFLQDTGPDWIDPTGYTYDANNKFTSYALYAQASYKIIEPVEVTVGARYNKDKKEAISALNFQQIYTGACGPGGGRSGFVNAFLTGQACNGILSGQGEETWSSFDPRVQLSYQFNPDIFIYGSITKGYNAGGFNQQLGTQLGGQLVPYEPEKLWAYEVGAKTEFWERRGRLNVTYFYQDYTDIQTSLLITFAGVATRQVQTGATARMQGIEAELELRPIPDLTLRANGAYLTQKYLTIRPGVTAFTLTTPVNATPKFTYSVSADYTFHTGGDGGTVVAGLNWRAVGKRPACTPLSRGIDPVSGLSCNIPAYGLLGGRLDWRPSDESPWTVGLWGTNLLDARTQISRNIGGGMGIDSIVPGRPREYGIEVRRTF